MGILAKKIRAFAMSGRFERAFGLSARLMAAEPPAEIVESIMYPFDCGLTCAPENILLGLLAELERRPLPKRLEAWRTLTKSVLLDRLHRSNEALRESEKLAALPRHHGWMRWHRGLLLLSRWDYASARADFRAVLDCAPQIWKATALLAEIDLADGNAEEAFSAMDRLARRVPLPDLISVRAWRGAMLLWTGQYRRALSDLDWAVERRSPLARCWRGGCLIKLRRFPEALQDLDAQLREHPEDGEARVWRGEARRLTGALNPALEDLDVVLERGNDLWARANRGLARARQGDREGLREDYAAIPAWVRAHFLQKTAATIGPDSAPETIIAQLEEILKGGRGVRRMNHHLFPLWIPTPAAARRPLELTADVFRLDEAEAAYGEDPSIPGREALLRVSFACNQNCGFCFVAISKKIVPLEEIEYSTSLGNSVP